MRLWMLWAVAVWLPAYQTNTDCQTDMCVCYKGDDFEYQCPVDNPMFILHVKPQEYVKIDCYQSKCQYDVDLFPPMDVGELRKFSVRFCLLPSHFNATVERFNITKINFMMIEGDRTMGPQTVTDDLLYGLPDVEILSLSSFEVELEGNFLQHLPNLTGLYLDNNQIRNITGEMFRYVPQLRVLHLSRNALSELPDRVFENFSNLQHLHLWKNQLTSLNKNTFVGLKRLQSLELSSNRIGSLDDGETFAELTSLVNISLRYNDLHTVHSDIFKHSKALEGVRFGNNPNLNLSDYVFANLVNLSNVNIDESSLESIPEHTFEGSVKLSVISLRNNNFTSLPQDLFKGLVNLRVLNLAENQIKELHENIFASLKNLEELYLQNNQLETIDDGVFRKTTKVKILNLSHNLIKTIDFHAFSQLEVMTSVDLSYNSYAMNYGNVDGLNPFNNCNNLQSINLSHNLIDTFPENILFSKVKLVSLDLSYNSMTNIRVSEMVNT